MTIKNAVLGLAAVAVATALSAAPAAALNVSVCRVGQSMSNGHCCPTGDVWRSDGTAAGGGCVPQGYGLSLPIDDPRQPVFKIPPCKALHTC